MTTTVSAHRRCAWKGCREAAKPRGKRGPMPRHCEDHTRARKRQINHNPVKPRTSRPSCCEDGRCPQHKQNRAEWRIPVYPLSRAETSWLVEQFGTAELGTLGFHITGPADPRGWNSSRGPDEGRTRPDVFNADPSGDGEAAYWLEDNGGWFREK